MMLFVLGLITGGGVGALVMSLLAWRTIERLKRDVEVRRRILQYQAQRN